MRFFLKILACLIIMFLLIGCKALEEQEEYQETEEVEEEDLGPTILPGKQPGGMQIGGMTIFP